MYSCNHLCLVGRLEANVHTVFNDNNEQLALFTLLIPIDDSKHSFRYHVCVENPLLVEYAESCLLEGKFVFVLGRLEPALEESTPFCIVISKDFGMLHPIGSHVHKPVPITPLNKDT